MSSKRFTGANLLEAEFDQRVVQEFTRLQATDIAIRDVEGASSRAVSQNASGGSIEKQTGERHHTLHLDQALERIAAAPFQKVALSGAQSCQ